jgi:hypothetical protein
MPLPLLSSPLPAGVIATDLARQMLEIYPNTYALVVSTENLTHNWYPGTSRGMLVTNTIFRVGGAAMLFSNKTKDSWCAAWAVAAGDGDACSISLGRGSRGRQRCDRSLVEKGHSLAQAACPHATVSDLSPPPALPTSQARQVRAEARGAH